MAYFRVDRITNMSILDLPATPVTAILGFESGINYKEIASALPYMYTDKIEHIEFKAHRCIIDQIVDWFGNEANFTEIDKDYVNVSIKASPNAMEHWAMQYINYVEVIKPIALRERIKDSINTAQEKYK